QQKLQQEMTKALEGIPYYQVFNLSNVAISWALDIALLCAGIGLLNSKLWARTLSLTYAVVSILSKIAMAVYYVTYFVPGFEQAMKVMVEEARKQPQGGAQAAQFMEGLVSVMKVGMVVMPFITMIYPVCVLLVLGRSSVKRALSGVPTMTPPEDYYDDRT